MKPENLRRDNNNRFLPVYKIWSLDNFNEGYITKHGPRFWVRLPGHHRANPSGNVLRSIAAYEAYHPGTKVTTDYVIHHKDENKLNDSKENLQLMKFGEHTTHHWKGAKRPGQNDNLKTGKIIKCEHCGKEIYRTPWETNKTNFCSQKCHYANKRKPKENRTCPECGLTFLVKPSSKKECCSRECGFKLKHKRRVNV